MIDKQFAEQMARYNRWQNANLYGCADQISSEDRKRERGAFFGSIHATLNHLLWADQIWMHRFAGTERPSGGIKESVAHYPDWQDLKREREALDKVILRWAESLDPSWPEGNLTWYSGAAQMEITRYVDPCGCSQPPYPARFCRRRTLSSRPSRSGGCGMSWARGRLSESRLGSPGAPCQNRFSRQC